MRHHTNLPGMASTILKAATCTLGALLALALVVVGALAASLVATGIGTLGLVRRTSSRHTATGAPETAALSEPVRLSEARRSVSSLAGCRSAA